MLQISRPVGWIIYIFSLYLLRAAHLGRVRPINNYILLQQRGGKLKFLLYFCSSQWRAVTNNFNLARLYINPSEPPVAVLVFHVWNGKHLKMSLSLLIVFFSASRIHCSVEWSFLLSLGHRVSSADLHTLAVDGTLVQPCVCVCVLRWILPPPFPSQHPRGENCRAQAVLKYCLTPKKHQAVLCFPNAPQCVWYFRINAPPPPKYPSLLTKAVTDASPLPFLRRLILIP